MRFGCAQLALDEHARDHADDPPAGLQRGVGDDAHEAEPPAAVHQRDARLRQRRAQLARRAPSS